MARFPYDIEDFIEQVKDKDYHEILRLAAEEGSRVQRASYKVRGATEARRQGSPQYARLLGGLVFFLKSGVKPSGIDDWDFQRFRPIAENLVRKDQFKPEVLCLFKLADEEELGTR